MGVSDIDGALLRLVTAVPAYAVRWEDETERDLPYVAAAHLAFFLGDEGALPAPDVCRNLGAVLEDLLTRGSSAVRNFVIVGFLEDLQNATLQAPKPLNVWEPWFGPATLEAWRAVIDLWDGRLDPQSFDRFVNVGHRGE